MNIIRSTLACAAIVILSACAGSGSNNRRISDLTTSQSPPAADISVADARSRAMTHYEIYLKNSRESELVPEALRRLADLNLEQEEVLRGENDAVAGGTPSRAAELYQELLTRFPDRPDNDRSVYQLARAYDLSSEPDPAMKSLDNYADHYASSGQIDEVQFRRGEYLFVRRKYQDAAQAYLSVARHDKESGFYRQALYKLGWSRFKLHNYEGSLESFMQLLDDSLNDNNQNASLPDNLADADRERLEDTLRAVSLGFVYLGDETEVQKFFQRYGQRNYEPLIYDRLATLHLSRERFSDAASTYSVFASVHPDHRVAPIFQSHVIDIYKKAGFHTRVLEEKQSFVERYVPAANYWKHHDITRSADVLDQVQRHLRDVSRHYHAQAQKVKTPAAFRTAADWYELYLASFPSSEQAPYINFLYAELLTTAGDHRRAAAQYQKTAYNYGKHGKASEAGYAALLAYEKHEDKLVGTEKSKWHRSGIDSSLRFSDTFPSHKYAIPVRVQAAERLYALGEYQAAINAAQVVAINSDAPDKLALTAWTVIAHARFDLHDYQRAESAYQQVLSRYAGSKETRAGFEEKLAASIYKQGEQSRNAGDHRTAAGHFLRISRQVPSSAINVTARYDAAAAYIAIKDWPSSIRVLESWRKAYPKHQLNDDVTRKLAVLYRENRQPLRAAAEFENLAATETNSDLRREARWTSANLYQQAGRPQKSIQAYTQYIKTFPQPVEAAMEARSQLVELYDKAGDVKNRRYWQKDIINADRTAGKFRTDRTRYLAANASLALVADQQAAYQRVRLREPLKKNLARKKKYMQAAIKGYTDAAGYGIAQVTTESTYHIAEIYFDFGRSLMESERPRDLNEDELEQYAMLLEEQAYPFEEQAIEIHETNVKRLADGNYDRWVKRSLKQLADLLPARYAKQERSENFVASIK